MDRPPVLTPRRPKTSAAPRGPVLLGILAALALLSTALFDRSDPLAAARTQVELEASARADTVRAAWARARAAEEDLAPATRGFAVLVPDEVPAFAVEDPSPSSSRMQVETAIAGLLAAASRARRTGEAERSEELLIAAELRATDRDSLARVLLERARVASAAGRPAQVQAARDQLAAPPLRQARIQGNSAALLAALVAPADPALARSVLLTDPRPLPPPRDVFAPGSDGTGVRWDPWWSEIETRLTRLDPDGDWSVPLRKEARMAEALRAWLGDGLAARPDIWSITQRDGALYA